MKLTMACKQFFFKDQPSFEVMANLKQLTDEDKKDLVKYFNKAVPPIFNETVEL